MAVVAYASLGCGQLLAEPVVQQVAARVGRTPAQVSTNVCAARGICLKIVP